MKVRRVDLTSDEFLAAVAGEMSPAELGVYWMICLLCYSRGGPIRYDIDWLRAKFRPGKGNNAVALALDRLIMSGRVVQDGPKIGVRRALDEVKIAQRRIRDASKNGRRGGRGNKKINSLGKGYPLSDEKLTITTNTTTNTNKPPTRPPRGAERPLGEFAEFWAAYPRKVGKDAAARQYAAARRGASAEEILAGARRYAASCPSDSAEKRFIAHPATWLRAGRWKDEDGPAEHVPDRPNGPPPKPDELWPDLREMRH